MAAPRGSVPADTPTLPVPSPGSSPCPRPHPTHRYWRCERPVKALSPINVNLLEFSRLQKRGRRRQHRGRAGWAREASGCPSAGAGDVQELQRGDVGEGCLSDLREGRVHHRPAGETKLQGYVGEGMAAGGALPLPDPSAPSLLSPGVCQCGHPAAAPGCWAGSSPWESGPSSNPACWGRDGGDGVLGPTAGAGTHPARAHALRYPLARVCMHTQTYSSTHTRIPVQGSGVPQGLCIRTHQPCPLGALVPKVTADGERGGDGLQPCSIRH